MYSVGVDVGGTFTDFVVYNEKEEKIDVFKIPSDKKAPWLKVIKGLKKGIKEKNEISDIRHGSTIGINAVIEGKGSVTALLTTKGFKDLLEIGRQKRPHLYNLHLKKHNPLIPGYLRIPVKERIDKDGKSIIQINEGEILEIAERLEKEKIKAAAILFLNSYVNSENEDKAVRVLSKKLPGIYISASSRIIPEFREYERLSTTVLNAYLGPIFKDYLENLISELEINKIKANLYISQSDGGLISPESAMEIPVRTLFSGPAAGVLGASFLYGSSSKNGGDTVTLDMGGTSTDVAIISGSKPVKTTEKKVMEYPVKLPAIDVFTIGAGGGSIAAVDEGGFLKVGPESSGAVPGPACYGRGGNEPTVTDANLVIGTLGVRTMLGGGMELNPEKAGKAIENRISKPLKISLIEGAWAVIRLVTSDISEAIRKISISKGFHPRDLKLIAYGGAGPMHAALVAEELGIGEIIVPETPGAFSARGLLYGSATMDFVKTIKGLKRNDVSGIITDFKNKTEAWFKKENIPYGKQRLEWSLDMRYKGQNYELNIPVSERDIEDLKKHGTDRIKKVFYKKHEDFYGYVLDGVEVEIVNLRLRCIGNISLKTNRSFYNDGGNKDASGKKPEKEIRKVYFNGRNRSVETPVYKRISLGCGFKAKGPAIIEQMDSTIVIPPGYRGEVGEDGSFIIKTG
ncbi:MAG: hydantoinase/oxoprolinase family protein [Actinomycetota bacterium]|nr:hydantoinase/oxoprolinase family protein [Actinomycetota bacterium]